MAMVCPHLMCLCFCRRLKNDMRAWNSRDSPATPPAEKLLWLLSQSQTKVRALLHIPLWEAVTVVFITITSRDNFSMAPLCESLFCS